MPMTQVASKSNYDVGFPATADAVLGWRVRPNRGGKITIKVERAVSDQSQDPGDATYSVQVAPAQASGEPGTFIATTAALNLEAVTNATVGLGQSKTHEILVRPNVDRFVLLKGAGGCRVQVQIEHDDLLDQWRTSAGMPALTQI